MANVSTDNFSSPKFLEELMESTINCDKLSGCKLNYIIPYLCKNYMHTILWDLRLHFFELENDYILTN